MCETERRERERDGERERGGGEREKERGGGLLLRRFITNYCIYLIATNTTHTK